MKILMIGATGTLSRPMTEFLKKNHEVFMLKRAGSQAEIEGVTPISGDANCKADLVRIADEYRFDAVCNVLIYNAGQARNNVEAFLGKVGQYLFISTCATYDHELSCYVDENMPQGNHYSEYGRDKTAAEAVFWDAYHQKGFPLTVVRPSQTYSNHRIPLSVKGKNCWCVVDRMLRGKEIIVHGDGQSVWASTHADDFAVGCCGLLGNEKAIGEAYQIMTDEVATWDMTYRELARIYGVEYKPVYIPSDLLACSKKYDFLTALMGDKQYSVLFDTHKIKEAVPQFGCKISIKEGLKKFKEYMDAHPEMQVPDPDFDSWCDQVISAYKEACNKVKEIL